MKKRTHRFKILKRFCRRTRLPGGARGGGEGLNKTSNKTGQEKDRGKCLPENRAVRQNEKVLGREGCSGQIFHASGQNVRGKKRKSHLTSHFVRTIPDGGTTIGGVQSARGRWRPGRGRLLSNKSRRVFRQSSEGETKKSWLFARAAHWRRLNGCRTFIRKNFHLNEGRVWREKKIDQTADRGHRAGSSREHRGSSGMPPKEKQSVNGRGSRKGGEKLGCRINNAGEKRGGGVSRRRGGYKVVGGENPTGQPARTEERGQGKLPHLSTTKRGECWSLSQLG